MNARRSELLTRGVWLSLGIAVGVVAWILASQISAMTDTSGVRVEYPRELSAEERQQYAEALEGYGVEPDTIVVYYDPTGVFARADGEVIQFNGLSISNHSVPHAVRHGSAFPVVHRVIFMDEDSEMVNHLELVFEDHVVSIPTGKD